MNEGYVEWMVPAETRSEMDRLRWIWVTVLPMIWLITITMTASYQKIFSPNLRIGFLSFANAQAARHEFWEQVRRVYEKFDLLLSPTLAVPPFAVGQDDADPVGGEKQGPLQWTRFTYPLNLTGQPAASVPAGWTKDGLPAGLQIIGDRHADLLVLQAARAWEQVQPWRDKRPHVVS